MRFVQIEYFCFDPNETLAKSLGKIISAEVGQEIHHSRAIDTYQTVARCVRVFHITARRRAPCCNSAHQ